MPRPRRRIVVCDCRDCLELPNSTGEAAARQEPPPSCLLLAVSGLHLSIQGDRIAALDDLHLPHLDALAREGSCGMLSVKRQVSTKGRTG